MKVIVIKIWGDADSPYRLKIELSPEKNYSLGRAIDPCSILKEQKVN